MANQFTNEDAALLAELGVEAPAATRSSYSPIEERVIAGFEEVLRFVEEHGRLPQHGEEKDIFERLYAVRLDRIRQLTEFHELLRRFDTAGIFDELTAATTERTGDDVSDEELLDALGVETAKNSDLTELKHVRPRSEIRAAEEVAQRAPCEDFDSFKPLFERVQREIDNGERRTVRYQENAQIDKGEFFILDGQKAFVAEMDKPFKTEQNRTNRRIRVVFDNGTEANYLLRSFQRALYKDDSGRRILPADSDAPALFSGEQSEDDLESGWIYVLRSRSDHPFIAENRAVIHKIGVTRGDIKKRIANARRDPTYLLADVEIVASFKLANLNQRKLEQLIHEFFSEVRLDLQLQDRFGGGVEPREWFLVPLPVIKEMIQLLVEGQLEHYKYESSTGLLVDTRTR